MTANSSPVGRARGGRRADRIEYIPEHRFAARFRAELTRCRGRLVAACVVTVVAPTVIVTGAPSAGTVSSAALAPAIASPPVAQAGEDPWVVHAQSAAASCPGLPASVLLAIGTIETGQGQLMGPSEAGARGPMQFLPTTWMAYGTDGDGDGDTDIMSPADALHAAARLLCANGGGDPSRLRSALWNYNHSTDYVDDVLRVAGLSG